MSKQKTNMLILVVVGGGVAWWLWNEKKKKDAATAMSVTTHVPGSVVVPRPKPIPIRQSEI